MQPVLLWSSKARAKSLGVNRWPILTLTGPAIGPTNLTGCIIEGDLLIGGAVHCTAYSMLILTTNTVIYIPSDINSYTVYNYNSGTFVCPSSPFSLVWRKRGYLRTGTPSVHWPSCTWTFGTPVHGKQYKYELYKFIWIVHSAYHYSVSLRSQLSVKARGPNAIALHTVCIISVWQCHAPPTFISPPS